MAGADMIVAGAGTMATTTATTDAVTGATMIGRMTARRVRPGKNGCAPWTVLSISRSAHRRLASNLRHSGRNARTSP